MAGVDDMKGVPTGAPPSVRHARERAPTSHKGAAGPPPDPAQTVITSPLLCGHILGMLVLDLGADHVLWGTDSFW